MSNVSAQEKERLVKLVMEKIKENRNKSKGISENNINSKQNTISSNEQVNGKSFIAISDFHGYDYPIDKIVNHYLNEYDCIYIMGDAIDRGPLGDGTGSLQMLRNIKYLTEYAPDRIFYLPGNHDQFLVGGVGFNLEDDLWCLENNAGCEKTVEEFEQLKKTNLSEFSDLMNWLLRQPLQRTHTYKGQKYVLSHAFFDQKIYNENPNFSLVDFFKAKKQGINNKLYADAYRMLWFRKGKDNYPIESCPLSDNVMVIGHNPNLSGELDSYDLTDMYGNNVKVHCVDGGLSYNAGEGMLKYDGGYKPVVTQMRFHSNTSSGTLLETDEEVIEQKRPLLENYIINEFMALIDLNNIEISIAKCKEFLKPENSKLPMSLMTEKECFDIIKSYEGKNGFSYGGCSISEAYSRYKKIILFNELLSIHTTKYSDYNEIAWRLNTFMVGDGGYSAETPELITSEYNARVIAQALGSQNMMEVLGSHNCHNTEDYLNMYLNNNNNYHR